MYKVLTEHFETNLDAQTLTETVSEKLGPYLRPGRLIDHLWYELVKKYVFSFNQPAAFMYTYYQSSNLH